MGNDELDYLWAIGNIVLRPLLFKKLDGIRSDRMLAFVAEEIAKSTHESTKSAMEFTRDYIAMPNIKKLWATAVTDRSDQGKKFLRFVWDHDFKS